MPRPGTEIVPLGWMARQSDNAIYDSECTIERRVIGQVDEHNAPVEDWEPAYENVRCVYGPLTESSPTWTARELRKLLTVNVNAWHLSLSVRIEELELSTGRDFRVVINGNYYAILDIDTGVYKGPTPTRMYIKRIEPSGSAFV